MKMCVDNKQRFHYIKVKIIGESIRLLEQPSRICDSLCKIEYWISKFFVTPYLALLYQMHEEHLLAQMTKAKSLLFLQKKKVC